MSPFETRPEVAAGPRPWRLTRGEYYRLGELGFFDGKRVELLNGEVIEMSPVGSPHTMSTSLVAQALGAAFGPGYYVRTRQPLRISGSEPEPDVAVVAGGPRDYPEHPATALLVVEVADTSLTLDLTGKAELYATAGIAEYWVIDLGARTLHVLRDPHPIGVGGHRYFAVRVLAEADTVAPLAAPQSAIRVADLLP